MTGHPLIWIGFSLLVMAVLALDLGVFHRKAHAVGFKEALSWTGVWVTLAVLFGAGVWFWAGPQKGLEFFTGYLIEYSLSADNVFVFVLIFSYFAVPTPWQHKVLFWGVLGALVMRLVMIGLGVVLIRQFGWILYVFGAFLLFTGLKMVFGKSEEIHPERNPVVRWFRKLVPVTSGYHGNRFVARVDGRHVATPLLVVLVCIEVSDLVFAVDSIPAIFAVTLDPFIVYTSNVFAILGLRSLYFVLAGMVNKFHYLKTGLGVVLAFVGVKMLLAHTSFKIDTLAALGVVAGVLAVTIAASLLRQPRPPRTMDNTPTPPLSPALPGVSTGLKEIMPAARPTFSEELRHLAHQFTERPATLAAILTATQGRGFDLLLVLICLPFLTPIPLPGLSTPFGFVVFLIGARLALGQKPWLPRRLLERELPSGFITKLLNAATRIVRWLEVLLRPRWRFLHKGTLFRRVSGLLIMISGLLLMLPLPIPLSNALPALTVVLLAAGAMERDGLFFVAGCVSFVVAAAYIGALAFGGAHVVDELRHAWFGA